MVPVDARDRADQRHVLVRRDDGMGEDPPEVGVLDDRRCVEAVVVEPVRVGLIGELHQARDDDAEQWRAAVEGREPQPIIEVRVEHQLVADCHTHGLGCDGRDGDLEDAYVGAPAIDGDVQLEVVDIERITLGTLGAPEQRNGSSGLRQPTLDHRHVAVELLLVPERQERRERALLLVGERAGPEIRRVEDELLILDEVGHHRWHGLHDLLGLEVEPPEGHPRGCARHSGLRGDDEVPLLRLSDRDRLAEVVVPNLLHQPRDRRDQQGAEPDHDRDEEQRRCRDQLAPRVAECAQGPAGGLRPAVCRSIRHRSPPDRRRWPTPTRRRATVNTITIRPNVATSARSSSRIDLQG